MGDTLHLYEENAAEKIKELAESIDICMFCTHSKNKELSSRPMSTQKVDNNGYIRFMSRKDSNKNRQIEEGSHVHLFYTKISDSHFMSIKGSASISYDREKIAEFFGGMEKAWFPEGKDDPDISLICVMPEEGYYRDTKSGKMVSLLKVAAAAITGKPMDDGIEGKLKL